MSEINNMKPHNPFFDPEHQPFNPNLIVKTDHPLYDYVPADKPGYWFIIDKFEQFTIHRTIPGIEADVSNVLNNMDTG